MAAQGKYDEAKPNFERALAIWEKTLGAEHTQVATGLNNLCALLEGRVLCSTVRCIIEVLSSSLTYLCVSMAAQSKYDEAKPKYERALAIWEKALGADHPQVAAGLSNLGSLLRGRVLGSTKRRIVEVLHAALTCFVCLHGSPRQVRQGRVALQACSCH